MSIAPAMQLRTALRSIRMVIAPSSSSLPVAEHPCISGPDFVVEPIPNAGALTSTHLLRGSSR